MINSTKTIIRVTLAEGLGYGGIAIFGTLGYGFITDKSLTISQTGIIILGAFIIGCLVGLAKSISTKYKEAPKRPVSHRPSVKSPRITIDKRTKRLRITATIAGFLTFFIVAAGIGFLGGLIALENGVSPDSQRLSLILIVLTIIPGIYLGVKAHDWLVKIWAVREEDL